MRKILGSITQYITKANNYNEDQSEKIEYALRIVCFELLKIIGVIIFFKLLGHAPEAIISIGVMATIKPFIGGYHEESQVRCFLSTIIVVACVVYIDNNINVNFVVSVILSSISLFCIWQQAPVVNPKMNLTKPALIKRNRIVGTVQTGIFLIISLIFFKYKLYSGSILWTIVFQALLMFNKRSLKSSD